MHSMTGLSEKLPRAINRLPELATNLWYSWNSDALHLFKSMNAAKWEEVYHNPVRLLAETDSAAYEQLASDDSFVKQYQQIVAKFDSYMNAGDTWFKRNHANHRAGKVAYFSAEFGYHESLPIYSGGLGILAGDHCKSASDLDLPFIGIGLLYKKGYFKQELDSFGKQHAVGNHYEFATLPVEPSKNAQGEHVYVTVQFPGREVRLQVWNANIGRVKVYLLDSNLPENSEADRQLTAQLYGGGQETRIAQEILLGMGGIKAIRALGHHISAYHVNEGHAAFMAIERIKEYLRQGTPFHVGLELVRSSTLFTTHTPVPAGHDAFPLDMFEHYFSPLFQEFGVHHYDFIELGLDRNKKLFNMTHLALNTSARRNGVSKLHGHVSREMFQAYHGHINVNDVPISHITNGVHLPTWMAPELKALLDESLASDWYTNQADMSKFEPVKNIDSKKLWDVHYAKKTRLIEYARENLRNSRIRNGESQERIDEVAHFLSADKLTIGFARRFATYKRATLLFSDLERLDRIVNHPTHPVQFIFAGKAHPADFPGQDLIQEIYRVSQLAPFKGKVVLLENYDMYLASHLVQGVDVWLNNPLRPYEASGTSGEKAALNGVPNLSILDGWWEEGYIGTPGKQNGWAITGKDDGTREELDQSNQDSLYSLIEHELMPTYYSVNAASGVAEGWVDIMKNSIISLAPVYNTDRMVIDYATKFYLPTMERGDRFQANHFAIAEQLADYKRFMFTHWHQLQIVDVHDDTPAHGDTKTVSITLDTGSISYHDFKVEIHYNEQQGNEWPKRIVGLTPQGHPDGSRITFVGQIPAHLYYRKSFRIAIYPIHPEFIVQYELPLRVQ